MTTEEQKQLYARVLEKNKGIEGLQANPDFLDWMELVPKAELKLINDRILNIDCNSEGWERRAANYVLQYQAINRAIVGLTETRGKVAQEARKKLKELED